MSQPSQSGQSSQANLAGQPPPIGLLHLREADVVRLCGLSAAALGMDLLARRALTQPRRDGARLSGIAPGASTGASAADEAPVEAWAELTGEAPQIGLLWGCSLHVRAGGAGCEHVAAILTAWIRAPADFVTPLAEAPVPAPTLVAEVIESAARDQRERNERQEYAEAQREAEREVIQPQQARLLSMPRQARPATPATLGDELRRLSAPEISAIARRTLGAEMEEAEARAKLETALRDPALLRTLVARLDAEAAEALAWLRLAGGALTSADLDALAARAGRPTSALRSAFTTLERHGLVFAAVAPASGGETGDEHGWRRLKGWRLAPETRDALPRELPIPIHERPVPALASSGAAVAGSRGRLRVEAGSARSLLLALALLARTPAPLGPLAAPPLAAGAADPVRGERHGRAGSALMPEDLPDGQAQELARGLGVDVALARVARRTLLWLRAQDGATAPAADLARVPPPARLHAYRASFRVWLAARSPAELVDLERQTKRVRLRYDHTHDAFRPAALAEEAAEARAWLARLLGQSPAGAWRRVADLLDLIWRVNPLFLRGRQMAFSAPAWRIERIADGRPLRPTARAEWDAAEGAYIAALLAGPLRWWGALDLASDAEGAPVAFRLTALGQFLLSQTPSEELERRAAAALTFDWGPMATLTRDGALATQPLAATPALLDLLERWAAAPTLAGGRLIYSFGADQACANFDLGLRPDDALATLRTLGLARAAQTLTPRLEGWRAGYGDARLTAGLTLVEGRDEATLREALARLPHLAQRARWLSPSQVALSAADGAALREALARKGWEL
ncbi:MAG TPA: hypothetical protein VHI51_01550 [Ktedonobacterales bacterium]|nr:hypothetical protein [Ktedonobacterales bacterium]